MGDERQATRLWIVLHGYGQLARYFLQNFEGLERDCLIVAPEGLSRYYTDGTFGRVGASWMTREDREFEIVDQAEYLNALYDVHTERATRIKTTHLLGFSQGVATAARWAAGFDRPFDQLVFWSGTLPPELPSSAAAAHWKQARIDLVHGEQDKLTNGEVLHGNVDLLRRLHLEAQVHRHPGGHALDRIILERLLQG